MMSEGGRNGGGIGRRISEFAATLWDLVGGHDTDGGIEPSAEKRGPPHASDRKSEPEPKPEPKPEPTPDSKPGPKPEGVGAGSRSRSAAEGRPPSMQARYDQLVLDMKRAHGIRVVRWRSSTSGCAWQVHYTDGTTARLIESPYPRGPMSCAVFLHEIGHHAIGFGTYRPRCLEEFHAWRWSFETMLALDLNLTEAVRRRRDEALHYAIRKAARRGLKRLPVELLPFLEPPGAGQPPLPALLPGPSSAADGANGTPDPAPALRR